MEDFTNPAYFHALWTAIVYGLKVFAAMVVVGGIFVGAAGGSATKNWETGDAH